MAPSTASREAGKMQTLPQFQTEDKDLSLLQNKWASILNPMLRKTILDGVQLSNIALVSGNNLISTGLGRKYQGYFLTGMRTAFAQLYEVPSTNPALNLTLNSNGSTTVDIWVY